MAGRMGSGLLVGAVVSLLGGPALAQQTVPLCPPPVAGEFLLLAQGRTDGERARVQAALPPGATGVVCQYLSDIVVRAGGFTDLNNANAWAQYLTETQGVPTFVVRPAAPGEAIAPPPMAIPAPPVATSPNFPGSFPAPIAPQFPSQPAAPVPTYAPRPLGPGFAVLVEYGNNPAVATFLQNGLGSVVGLAVYRQRPYLIAIHSSTLAPAATVLQRISASNLTAFVVDSQEVVLLSPAVVLR